MSYEAGNRWQCCKCEEIVKREEGTVRGPLFICNECLGNKKDKNKNKQGENMPFKPHAKNEH